MTLDEWKQAKAPRGKWRLRARRAMLDAVNSAPPGADLLKIVDAAYPFGMRKYQPYKDWLAERKLFRAALAGAPEMPTEDEVGVCEVARDLIELGRCDEARRLVEEQAPHRLARECPTCGAASRKECFAMVPMTEPLKSKWHGVDRGVVLIVPHHARLIGHLGSGPLFGEASP